MFRHQYHGGQILLSKMSRIADSGGHLEFEGQELMKSLKQP